MGSQVDPRLTKLTIRSEMSADTVLNLRDRCGDALKCADIRWDPKSHQTVFRFSSPDGCGLLQALVPSDLDDSGHDR